MRNDNESSFILNQICRQKLQFCLSIYRLLLQTDLKNLLKEYLKTVYCIFFCILEDCKHSFMYSNAL